MEEKEKQINGSPVENEDDFILDEDYTDKIYNLTSAYSVLLEMEREIDWSMHDKTVKKKFDYSKNTLFNSIYFYCKKLDQYMDAQ